MKIKKTLLLLICISFCLISIAQNDTLVIIVDRNADYVFFDESIYICEDNVDYKDVYQKGSHVHHFGITIRCHYYDGMDYDWVARLELTQIKNGYRNWSNKSFVKKIATKDLRNYKLFTSDDINKIKIPAISLVHRLVYENP